MKNIITYILCTLEWVLVYIFGLYVFISNILISALTPVVFFYFVSHVVLKIF